MRDKNFKYQSDLLAPKSDKMVMIIIYNRFNHYKKINNVLIIYTKLKKILDCVAKRSF